MQLVTMLVIWVVVGLVVGALDCVTRHITSVSDRIFTIVLDTLSINIITMLIIRFAMHGEYIFDPAAYHGIFNGEYILCALCIGLLLIVIKGFAFGDLQLVRQKAHYSPARIAVMVVSVLAAIIGAVLLFGAWWFIGFIGKLTPEQIMFNFFAPVSGAADNAMTDIMTRPVLLAVTVVGILLLIMLTPVAIKRRNTVVLSNASIKTIASVLCVLLCVGGGTYAYKTVHAGEIIKAYTVKSTYIADNYVNPAEAKLEFPKKPRNLIHVYFESAENSYLDKSHGGYMEQNLMPDLMKFADEGAVHFSHREKKGEFGGPHQTYGSSWSVAGMVNMTFGIPMKVPTDGNSYGMDGRFMPGATGTIDLLARQGYNQTVMFGADANFGGLTSMFTTHGNVHIFDWKYAIGQGLIPPNYKVWWGFEDNKLYEYAKNEITRLAGEKKPFHFIMENADTHFPDGFLEPETERKFGSQYADVIFHSQKQLADFVRWVQSQPFYENTTIVITGDHLSMDQKFFKDFDPRYERTTFNMFINPAFTNKRFATHNRQYAPFDYMPTIMNSLGVQIPDNKLGLGTNLASDMPTLIERDGREKVEDQLSLYSKFYATNILQLASAKRG